MRSDRAPADSIAWLSQETVPSRCLACDAAGDHRAVLRIPTLGAERRWITLVECASCGLRFFPGLDPVSYRSLSPEAAILPFDFGNGIAGSVDCLARLDTSGVRSMLEVGCGTGFTLDFARQARGWRCQGVDESQTSRLARDLLDVDVFPGRLEEAAGLGRYDLVFACEVIEHLTSPLELVGSIRALLSDGGVFLLRTPDGGRIGRDLPLGAMREILSPGGHAGVHTADSLERMLRRAGFGHVVVLREGNTLHAAAGDRPFEWFEKGRLEIEELISYLEHRVTSLPLGSAARSGLLQELVNRLPAIDPARAAQASEALREQFLARHGVDLADLETLLATALAPDDGLLGPFLPSLLCRALYARAIIAALAGDREAAAQGFAAAARAGAVALERFERANLFDPGTERTEWLARLQSAVLARPGPSVTTAAEELRSSLDGLGAERAPRLLEAFSMAVGSGALELAGDLALDVDATLTEAGRSDGGWTAIEAEGAFALAMVYLHHASDCDAAVRWFGAAARAPSLDRSRRWSARFHEGYARYQAGDRSAADQILHEVLSAAELLDGPDAAEVDHARRLLEAGQAQPDVTA